MSTKPPNRRGLRTDTRSGSWRWSVAIAAVALVEPLARVPAAAYQQLASSESAPYLCSAQAVSPGRRARSGDYVDDRRRASWSCVERKLDGRITPQDRDAFLAAFLQTTPQ